jgi:hypothetical protein
LLHGCNLHRYIIGIASTGTQLLISDSESPSAFRNLESERTNGVCHLCIAFPAQRFAHPEANKEALETVLTSP